MKLHSLKPAQGATHKEKRLGRGEASGKGGTSTKGNKGHQSRSGFKSKMTHEGGQMPIQRRLPKRGFTNIDKQSYRVFNLGQIEAIIEKYELTEFSADNLYINKLINRNDKVKLLGTGSLKGKYNFKVHQLSEKAKKGIELSGGTVEIIK